MKICNKDPFNLADQKLLERRLQPEKSRISLAVDVMKSRTHLNIKSRVGL